jgi:hypothetical protein
VESIDTFKVPENVTHPSIVTAVVADEVIEIATVALLPEIVKLPMTLIGLDIVIGLLSVTTIEAFTIQTPSKQTEFGGCGGRQMTEPPSGEKNGGKFGACKGVCTKIGAPAGAAVG